MNRCIELALLGKGNVAPNPMVGAILVYEDKIIGEGYHQQYGQAHAEVNCIKSVSKENMHLIADSTLYVSLEPCAHFGKTPPCADLIIQNRIPKVVIGCRDRFAQVNGKGIEKMITAGIEVVTPVLENDAIELNKRFFTFHQQQRPYIILKWAQTANRKIAAKDNTRLLISNEITNRMVHKWRSEETAILVGTNTALKDNPSLTARLWPGNNPLRLVVDMDLKLPPDLHLFDGSVKTIIFNAIQQQEQGNLFYYKLTEEQSIIPQMMKILFKLNIQSLIVEGGANLLQHFIDTDYWDEARVITGNALEIATGLDAPVLAGAEGKIVCEMILSDSIRYYKHA